MPGGVRRGVQPEMEVAFAALYSLCAPLLDLLDGLPEPQSAALGTAFGWREGRRRIGCCSAWPCSACSRRRPRSARWCA
ncbi:hypothetical protein ACFQ0B_32275 [Nonomuraea thailandensis]